MIIVDDKQQTKQYQSTTSNDKQQQAIPSNENPSQTTPQGLYIRFNIKSQRWQN